MATKSTWLLFCCRGAVVLAIVTGLSACGKTALEAPEPRKASSGTVESPNTAASEAATDALSSRGKAQASGPNRKETGSVSPDGANDPERPSEGPIIVVMSDENAGSESGSDQSTADNSLDSGSGDGGALAGDEIVAVCPTTDACISLQGAPLQFWNDRRAADGSPDNFPLGRVEDLKTVNGTTQLSLVSDVERRAVVQITPAAVGANPQVNIVAGYKTNMCYDHNAPRCAMVTNNLGQPDINCSSHIRWVYKGISTTIGESTCRRCVIRGGAGNTIKDFRAESFADCQSQCAEHANAPNRACRHYQPDSTVVIKDRPMGTCLIENNISTEVISQQANVSQGQCYWSCKGDQGAEKIGGLAVLDEEFPTRYRNANLAIERPTRRCKWNGQTLCEGDGATSCNTMNWFP